MYLQFDPRARTPDYPEPEVVSRTACRSLMKMSKGTLSRAVGVAAPVARH